VTRDCLIVIAADDTITVARLEEDFELDHRVGDLISDGLGGQWLVDEATLEQRCLVLREIMAGRYVMPELLAA
jgi:hypothetical protein